MASTAAMDSSPSSEKDELELPLLHCFVATGTAIASDAPRRRILAYGDSLTAGFCDSDGELRFSPYGKALCEALAPSIAAEIWVCGLSGMEAAEMAQALDCRSIEDCVGRIGKGLRRTLKDVGNVDLVLIMAGTNDLGDDDLRGAPIAITVQALHTACHCEGVPTVVLSVPANENVQKSQTYRKRWERVNALLRKWSESNGRDDGVCFFVETALLVPFSEDSDLWDEDGLHLTAAGSRHLGTSLAPLVLPLLDSAASLDIRAAVGQRSKPKAVTRGGPMPECLPMLHPSTPSSGSTSTESAPKVRLLFYGDSLTAGYYAFGNLFAPYAEAFGSNLFPQRDTELWVCGLSGLTAVSLAQKKGAEKIRDATKRTGLGLQRLLDEHGCFDLVFIMLGTNDLGKSEPEEIAAAIQELHSVCHQAGVPTVVMSVPQSKATFKSRGLGKIAKCHDKVNRLLHNWATGTSSAKVALFVDTCALMPFEEDSELWEMDGLHFSRAGSQALGARLAPLVGYLQARHGISSFLHKFPLPVETFISLAGLGSVPDCNLAHQRLEGKVEFVLTGDVRVDWLAQVPLQSGWSAQKPPSSDGCSEDSLLFLIGEAECSSRWALGDRLWGAEGAEEGTLAEVCGVETFVDVRWQDDALSVRVPARELQLCNPDAFSFFPSELVCQRLIDDSAGSVGPLSFRSAGAPPPVSLTPPASASGRGLSPAEERPSRRDGLSAKVGYVVRADPATRMVSVRWLDDAVSGKGELELKSVEKAIASEEEWSAFDLQIDPEFGFRLGDAVIRCKDWEEEGRTLSPPSSQPEVAAAAAALAKAVAEAGGPRVGQVLSLEAGKVRVRWLDGAVSVHGPRELYRVGDDDEASAEDE
ncbi:unnamed protein product, partial [Polarella glacialis]